MKCPRSIKMASIPARAAELISGSRLRMLKKVLPITRKLIISESAKVFGSRAIAVTGLAAAVNRAVRGAEPGEITPIPGINNAGMTANIHSMSGVSIAGSKEIKSRLEELGKTMKHPQALFTKKDISGDGLDDIGFKRSVLDIPLPGKRLFGSSWRNSGVHVHAFGDVYLAHLDKSDPMSGIGKAIKHNITEAAPAAMRRWLKREAPYLYYDNKPCRKILLD